MRVLTITMNPAIDQTIGLARLIPGQVHRADSVRYNAGGKGINVSSCLADWGLASAALGILGGGNGAMFEELFKAKGIKDLFLRVPGLSRTNIKLVDGRDTTDVNLPGPPVTPADLSDLERALEACLAEEQGEPGLAVLAGSLPPDCPADLYARLTGTLKQRGWKVVLDAVGEPLRLALAGPRLPDCIKPNRAELAELTGKSPERLDDLAAAARELQGKGVGLVVLSLGQDGALFFSSAGTLKASAVAENVASTVGAGDAMVAGIAAGLCELAGSGSKAGLAYLERLARLGTAFSVGKLGRSGPNLPPRSEVEALAAQVKIEAAEL